MDCGRLEVADGEMTVDGRSEVREDEQQAARCGAWREMIGWQWSEVGTR